MKLREPFTFVGDACLGRIDFPNGLRAAIESNEKVELLDDHFAQGAKDADWIPTIGARGWIVLTKDSALLRNPLEVEAMRNAKTVFIVVRNASVTGEQLAKGVVLAVPRIRKVARRFDVSAIARMTVNGDVDVLFANGAKLTPPKRVK